MAGACPRRAGWTRRRQAPVGTNAVGLARPGSGDGDRAVRAAYAGDRAGGGDRRPGEALAEHLVPGGVRVPRFLARLEVRDTRVRDPLDGDLVFAGEAGHEGAVGRVVL